MDYIVLLNSWVIDKLLKKRDNLNFHLSDELNHELITQDEIMMLTALFILC